MSKKGQRHLSGLWWSATTGGHVGFESWLEREHAMVLDFDPAMVGALDVVLVGNLRWLGGYRHPRDRLPKVPANELCPGWVIR